MTAINTFKFGEYLMRPANEFDRPLAERWTAADPEHAGLFEPDFWLEQRLGRDSLVLSDRIGPLLFFKMHVSAQVSLPTGRRLTNAVQLLIQFPDRTRERTPELRPRLARGLAEGCHWLERTVAPMGAKALFFDSKNESLIRFSVSRLGFCRDGDNLIKTLAI